MVAAGEDELTCDFAETYRILNWRGLPVSLAATLAFGLSDNSRIKRKMSGQTVCTDMIMQASILDALRILIWMQSADGAAGKNRPESIAEGMLKKSEQQKEYASYGTKEELLHALYGEEGG